MLAVTNVVNSYSIFFGHAEICANLRLLRGTFKKTGLPQIPQTTAEEISEDASVPGMRRPLGIPADIPKGRSLVLPQMLLDILPERAIFLNGLHDLLMGMIGKLSVQVFHFGWIIRVNPYSILLSGVLFVVCHNGVFIPVNGCLFPPKHCTRKNPVWPAGGSAFSEFPDMLAHIVHR